jgi:hypothetical protein
MTDPEKNLLRMIERNAFYTGLGVGLVIGAFACFTLGVIAHSFFHL